MGDSCTGSERGMSCFNSCSSGIQEVTLIKQKKNNMIHEKNHFSYMNIQEDNVKLILFSVKIKIATL